ncbi:MAG: hypothetical protein KC933_11310 [Myxococcales bacterium]|nr:hypothetical protein [Myxococcales bacterium]MCB9650672.1 hypothetical protein [Deltaproteobacteria bacterium]
MAKIALPTTPTPDEASKAWTRGFAAAVRDAAGDSARLTPKKAAGMEGIYADNARNYFERTGRSWATADTVIDSGARYVRRETEKAAGADQKLSLVDIRKLPADLQDDMLTLRGKAPSKPANDPKVVAPSPALTAAVAASEIPSINDYGKYMGVDVYPKTMSRAEILRKVVGYDDLTDAEIGEWFSSVKGSAAVADLAGSFKEIGAEEKENWDDDRGVQHERIFSDVAEGLGAQFIPVSKFKSVELAEHFIQEDGDCEYRLLIGKQKDDSWLVFSYSNFPF